MDYKILEDNMINIEKLNSILNGYIAYFPEHWKDEKYKWQAVKCFQDKWDINAKNFEEMFMAATDGAKNLLTSANFYPRKMILNFAKADTETTRSMFRKLYDESLPLKDRVNAFQTESEALRTKYDDLCKSKQFDPNSIDVENISKENEVLKLENQKFREMVHCKVCKTEIKNVVITKCFHTFCKKCIDAAIESRKRRGPICRELISQNDVKKIFWD